MDLTCNPTQKRGKRNLYCAHYRDCLNHAIEKFWMQWTCSHCPNKGRNGEEPEGQFGYVEKTDPDYSRIPDLINWFGE